MQRKVKPELAMIQDPLIRAAKKAYRESLTYKVDMLYAERSRWSRKLTIASNKLAKVDEQIERLLVELGKKLDEADENKAKPAAGTASSQ